MENNTCGEVAVALNFKVNKQNLYFLGSHPHQKALKIDYSLNNASIFISHNYVQVYYRTDCLNN